MSAFKLIKDARSEQIKKKISELLEVIKLLSVSKLKLKKLIKI